jgi:hypothetical protein
MKGSSSLRKIKYRSSMLAPVLGYLMQLAHGLLMIALWLSPFYIRNPQWLLVGIVIQVLILMHQYFLNDQCILVLLEDWLTGAQYSGSTEKRMFLGNRIAADLIGKELYQAINAMLPYLFILGASYKISTLI